MNGAEVNREHCKLVLDRLDSALDMRQMAETDFQLLRHLESCPECSRELQARLAIRGRLRAAVRGFSVTPDIERRLSDHAGAAPRPSGTRNVMLIAAALVLSAGTAITYRLGHLRLTPGARESYISSISLQVSRVMRVGLGDHVNCAVFHELDRNPPPAGAAMPPEYGDLTALVKNNLPAGYRVVTAHQCRYHGRKFIHLSATDGSGLISLVITRKAEGESFAKDHLAQLLSQSGIALYRENVQRFEIAGFETRDHLVYVVSDLSWQQNLDLMAALAPGVRDVLHRLEA
ncbi:MAG TPA: hypothetical protein VKG25_16895 [Bryobacteraceae bacterium]|nr:hypothetical protein [Bryobacteraceae bacterium]